MDLIPIAQNEQLYLSFDRTLVDQAFVYDYLHTNMYWAAQLKFEAFQRSLQHSAVVIGAYDQIDGNRQIGFARVVSDCATFAYLTDVFVVEEYRGLGISKALMKAVLAHPQLQGLRRFVLVTSDAGGLYEKFGFKPLTDAGHWMQIFQE